ncbi:hypothetical protein SUDANB15_03892 [Streptomyces sp. enrichment culture]|uniref:Uncharacterized protein n=1 Tax=Streptomyces griseomycini TaxID=66895 RepID=A0A7W7PQZ6_9ACTN|nr:hypothetical protein [Streptomyces griseomycini]
MPDARRRVNRAESGRLNSYLFLTRNRSLTCADAVEQR